MQAAGTLRIVCIILVKMEVYLCLFKLNFVAISFSGGTGEKEARAVAEEG